MTRPQLRLGLGHVAPAAIGNLCLLACRQCLHGGQRIARVQGAPKNLEVLFRDELTIGVDAVARYAAGRRAPPQASPTGPVRMSHESVIQYGAMEIEKQLFEFYRVNPKI